MSDTILIDLKTGTLALGGDGPVHPLGSEEAFSILSKAWLRAGWESKYSYGFSWFGRPVIQLPEDLIRWQEIIYSLKPDVIIETGVAHGGSLVFHASLCRAMGRGRVVGIDIDIRPHNRRAIESHELFPLITLIEGNSIDPGIVRQAAEIAAGAKCVLVLLDSCHAKSHVLAELRAYSPLVTTGSYIIATDGIMRDLANARGAGKDWAWDNPREAAEEFVVGNPDFAIEDPPYIFNESSVRQRITYSPGGCIKRLRSDRGRHV